MYVKEINEVKEHLASLQTNGYIREWALPYENLLTRLNAAIFFLTPSDGQDNAARIWDELGKYNQFSYRINQEKTLSQLHYRVTFSKEEKEKNLQAETTQPSLT